MRSFIAAFALLSALSLTANAVSAGMIGLNSTITVTIKNYTFVPGSVSVRDGDTIKVCNSDPTFHVPFSMSKGNKFGNQRGQQINLAPGACTTQMVHNRTGGPIEMKIHDAIRGGFTLNVTIAPQHGVAAAKPSSAAGGLTGTWKGTGPGGNALKPLVGSNDNWAGTYKDGTATITISAGGGGLKGSWENKFDGSGSQSDTGHFTCKVTGKTAHCDYTGSYNDLQKTISGRVGTVDLGINGTTITVTVNEVSDTLTWTKGDQGYTPAIHPGATFRGTWIRQ